MSCTINSGTSKNQYPVFNFGEEILLEYGKTVAIQSHDLLISLSNVEDSRCPKGVSCVWAGKATGHFSIQEKEIKKSIKLEAKGLCNKDCGETKAIDNYTIELIQIHPQPVSSKKIQLEEYSATFIINKN